MSLEKSLKKNRLKASRILHWHGLFAFTLQQITGKLYWMCANHRENSLALAMRILNRISFSMRSLLIHKSATLCWYGSTRIHVILFYTSLLLKVFWRVIHDLLWKNQELDNEIFALEFFLWEWTWLKDTSFTHVPVCHSYYLKFSINIQRQSFAWSMQSRISRWPF